MKRYFNALFFKGYAFYKRLGHKEDDALFTSTMSLTILIFLNIISVISFYRCLVLHENIKFPSIIVNLVIFVVISIAVYSRFMYKNKYEALFPIYRKDLQMHSKKGTLLIWLYLIFTICLLLGVVLTPCG
jgi:hypothetical protein